MTSSTESRHLIKAKSSARRVRRPTYSKDRQPLGWSVRKASRDSNQGQRDAFCRVPGIRECTRPHHSNGSRPSLKEGTVSCSPPYRLADAGGHSVGFVADCGHDKE